MTEMESIALTDALHPLFVGRDSSLKSLRSALLSERLVVLMGARGSGKTALARAYVRSFAHTYTHVLWLDATIPETLLADALAQSERFPWLKESVQKGLVGVKELIETWAAQQQDALLVLDNVFFPENAPLPQMQLPIAGHVLLIGRSVNHLPTATCLEIGRLDEREGMQLVLHQAGLLEQDGTLEQVQEENRLVARELVRELAGSPLALTLAGGYLKATGCDAQSYLLAYRDCPERASGSPDEAAYILETACDLTLAQLERSQPVALRLLRCCALLSCCSIPRVLIEDEELQSALFSETSLQYTEQLHEAIQKLLTYKLLDAPDEMSDTFTMHPQLQAAIRRVLPEEQQRSLSERLLAACLHLAHLFEIEKEHGGELHAISFMLASHIRYLSSVEENTSFSSPQVAEAFVWAADVLGGQGLIGEAEALLRRALGVWERTTGYANPNVARVLFDLAILNAHLRRYLEAEAYAHRAVTLTAEVLGIQHWAVLSCLDVLATIYRQQGKVESAAFCYQKILSIAERVGLQQHPLCQTAHTYLHNDMNTGKEEKYYHA